MERGIGVVDEEARTIGGKLTIPCDARGTPQG
jgi:hypothetical protein